MEPNQDNGLDELEAIEEIEGDEVVLPSNPSQDDEADDEQQLSEFFSSSQEEKKESPQDKPREGIINRQVELLLSTEDEYEREEILSKYPRLKKDIESRYNAIVGEEDKLTKLEKEIQSLKESLSQKQEKSDKEQSLELLKSALKEHSLSSAEFKAEYGKEFTDEILKLEKRGFTRLEATKYALATVGLQVAKDKKVLKESREAAATPARSAKGGSFAIVSSDSFLQMSPSERNSYKKTAMEKFGEIRFK